MGSPRVRLGVIGGGVMAEAIVSRLIAQQLYAPQDLLVSDISPQRLDYWIQTYQVQVTIHNQAVISASDCLLLAIKPQGFQAVVTRLELEQLQPSALVISILAGVTLAQLEAVFGNQPVIRAMPNTPATVGAGITALAVGQYTTPQDLALAQGLFQAVGTVVQVPDALMDAVTGLSGSGPAFVAIAIEALTDGGVAAGLPRTIASQLALQTVLGTATLLTERDLSPAQLKDQVTSPGGTTIAGVGVLEQAGLRSALFEAVLAAYRRSQTLAQHSA